MDNETATSDACDRCVFTPRDDGSCELKRTHKIRGGVVKWSPPVAEPDCPRKPVEEREDFAKTGRCAEGNHEWYLRHHGEGSFCRRCGKVDEDL